MLIGGVALIVIAVFLGVLDAMGFTRGAAVLVNALLAAGAILLAGKLVWVSLAEHHQWHRTGA